MRSVRKELNPPRRVDNDQNRSFFSLKPIVLIPRTKPRIDDIGFSGTSEITSPLAMTW